MLSKGIDFFTNGSNSKISDAPSPREEISKGTLSYSRKAAGAAGFGVLFILSLVTVYRVRELAAELFFFSIAFGALTIAVLLLWLVERLAHMAVTWLESLVANLPTRMSTPARVRARHDPSSRTWN